VTRELIHERLERMVLFAQQAAERAHEVLGRRPAAPDERVEPVEQAGRHRTMLLEGCHDYGNGPISHAVSVAPTAGGDIT
jgi:hypothetical protein